MVSGSSPLLWILLGILFLDFIMDQLLDYLNLKHHKKELPEELKGIYDEDSYRKSQEYHQATTRFSFITSTFNFLLVSGVIITGTAGWLDGWVKESFLNPVASSLIFFGILFIASDLIHLPFSIYRTFVIEERFGFNKMTPNTFMLDKIKGYFLGAIVGGILLSVLLILLNKLGRDFWIWFWLVIAVFMIFLNMFYTSLIVPLFNKLRPLENGPLREAIESYSQGVGFPLTNVFVIDGSKRSTKANAYFSGLGPKKKVVLFDTLINNHTTSELVAVLAHEVGHFKKKHILVGLLLSLVQTGAILFILSLVVFNPALSIALGADELSIPLNLIAFSILFTPISHLTGIFMNMVSRKNEFEADRYAAETFGGSALQEALKKLSVNNLSNLTPHPAYVFVHYSHPPLLERLKALKAVNRKEEQ